MPFNESDRKSYTRGTTMSFVKSVHPDIGASAQLLTFVLSPALICWAVVSLSIFPTPIFLMERPPRNPMDSLMSTMFRRGILGLVVLTKIQARQLR
jgi:hypothetical protein